MCATCHGVQGEGGMGGLAAKLAEQSPEEIVRKLTAYQNKEQVGPQSQMMWGFAAALTAEEIENLAAYIATLK
jgi:cytochrome c553